MIKREKWIFSSFARIIGLLLLAVIAAFVFFYVMKKSLEQSNHAITLIALGIFFLIALFLGLGRAKMRIDVEKGYMLLKMGLLGIPLFKDNKKLPLKIQKVLVRKKEMHWKTSMNKMRGNNQVAFSNEVLLISLKGKPIRLFDLHDQSDLHLIDDIAKAYQVIVEFKEVK